MPVYAFLSRGVGGWGERMWSPIFACEKDLESLEKEYVARRVQESMTRLNLSKTKLIYHS